MLVGGLAGGQVADLAPSVAATGEFEGLNGANGGVLGTLAPTTGCVGRIHAAQDRSFYGPEELESSDSVFSTLLPRSGADPGGRAVCRGGGASTIRRSMRFESVHIESLGLALPPRRRPPTPWRRGASRPLYDRLGVSVGRLGS